MNWLKCQHPWTVVALLLAGVALGVGAGHALYPMLAAVFLLGHLLTGFTLPGPPRALFALLLMIPFGLWSRWVLTHSLTGWFLIDLLMLIGFYGVALGAYILTSAQSPSERQQALAAALFSFALAGAAPQNPAFAPLMALFVPVLLLQVRHELGLSGGVNLQPGPLTRYALALVLLLLVWLSVHALTNFSLRGINEFMTRRMILASSYSHVGYARHNRVGLHQNLELGPNADRVMIRCWAPRPMEYLRGAVYDQYQHGTWQRMEESLEFRPVSSDNATSGRSLFNLTAATPDQRLGWIYPDRSIGHTFFMPLGTQVFSSYAKRLYASEAHTLHDPRQRSFGGYEVFAPLELRKEPSPYDWEVPDDLREILAHLVRSITPDSDPPTIRVEKIRAWFAEHFRYQLGMKRLTEKDPILEFLQDQRRGHCEYFASAAVLMLRSIDIPARYVTGFVLREQAGSNLWLARQKDAHAWVEWVLPENMETPLDEMHHREPEETGVWITFDPTPADGQPQPLPAQARSPWGDWFSAWWERIVSLVRVGGVGAILALLWECTLGLALATPWYIWLIVMILALTWVFRASLRNLLRPGPQQTLSPQARFLRQKLRQAEKLARPFGVSRPPATTVTTFRANLDRVKIPPEVRARILALLDEYQSQRFRRSDSTTDFPRE